MRKCTLECSPNSKIGDKIRKYFIYKKEILEVLYPNQNDEKIRHEKRKRKAEEGERQPELPKAR